jgi:hypothetical protein
VESGGLTRVRQREIEEHQQLVRQRADRAAGATSIPTFGHEREADRFGGSLVGEFLAALFDD